MVSGVWSILSLSEYLIIYVLRYVFHQYNKRMNTFTFYFLIILHVGTCGVSDLLVISALTAMSQTRTNDGTIKTWHLILRSKIWHDWFHHHPSYWNKISRSLLIFILFVADLIICFLPCSSSGEWLSGGVHRVTPTITSLGTDVFQLLPFLRRNDGLLLTNHAVLTWKG